MPSFVSVVLPIAFSSDAFMKLLLPIDALKVVDAQKWIWIPTLRDAVCDQPVGTLLTTLGVAHKKETSQIAPCTYDFR
jgi:hypothetical protein